MAFACHNITNCKHKSPCATSKGLSRLQECQSLTAPAGTDSQKFRRSVQTTGQNRDHRGVIEQEMKNEYRCFIEVHCETFLGRNAFGFPIKCLQKQEKRASAMQVDICFRVIEGTCFSYHTRPWIEGGIQSCHTMTSYFKTWLYALYRHYHNCEITTGFEINAFPNGR